MSWAVSGFVVGVFVTLIANGLLHGSSTPTAIPPTPTPRQVGDVQLRLQLTKIVNRALGPNTDQKQARLLKLQLLRVRSIESISDPVRGYGRYRSVYVVFRLNDNPLGRVWRLRTAKSDVFQVMKALYTSGLPIYDALLVGRFPLQTAKGIKDSQAVVAYESHQDAVKVPWRRWGRDNEGRLWNQLSSKSVDSRFA